MKKVKTVLNPCGLRVKKCCASCINKLVDNDGMRLCPIHNLFVESGHVCKKWQMDYNTSQAGVCRGRVHKKEYLMFALAIRLGEGVEALKAKKQGKPEPESRTIESIRREYETDYGTTILLDI
ncbi:hypothetical protein [Prevotella sp. P6B1]|jgi:hypothetical protein|uniref:hypothetical protein n=1 Tax=Prevotella sp. P6B1 TaxID=1410613 RepID=UPI00051C3024|nr:hypothetical protein [Prevotella sp. P6B1]